MTHDMQTWLVEMRSAFPDEEVIDPPWMDEWSAMSDDEKADVLADLTDEEESWAFDDKVSSTISPAEAEDYYMVEFAGFRPSEYAEYRHRGTESIRKNRRQAETKLKALFQYSGENFMPDVEVEGAQGD